MGDPVSEAKQIGRFLILGELGRGGMGVVYRGEDRLIGREVAVKTLNEVTPELRERFYLEARSGILSHPNIVTVYELGEQDGRPFIAMELVAGDSLEKMLRTRKRIPLLEGLSIVEQLCAGLGHAHNHGVVHRDVKPANVLVRPDGRVTIVDFGIARLADQTRQLTKTDALLGTFHYIAPERLKGEPSDGRADIWSVGVMLYEMLSGELPFKGKDVSSLYRVINERFVPLQEYVQSLPHGLEQVLERALAKELQHRYATAEEMAFDLQMIAESLKQDRVDALLQSARKLAEDREYANARAVLLQAQRIDPRNTDAKALVLEVQNSLNELQRGEQLRQLVEQAQTAQEAKRWEDAVLFLQQAQTLDTEGAFSIPMRLQNVEELRAQQQALVGLWEQANEARRRGDLPGAQWFLSEALRIDARSTDLRNAYSVVVREIRRKQEATKVEELLRGARESYTMRRYTEAIENLRTATEIDPSNPEVQELLFTASTKQRDERRQHLLDRLVLEIQESLDSEDFSLAEDRVTRALDKLPGEAALLRLQEELLNSRAEHERTETVRAAMLLSQDLFADDPIQAMEAIEAGLAKADGDPTLLQARERLQQHLVDAPVAPVSSGSSALKGEPDEADTEPLEMSNEAHDAGSYSAAKVVASPASISAQPSAKHGWFQRSSRIYFYAGGGLIIAAVLLVAGHVFHHKRPSMDAPQAVAQKAVSAPTPAKEPAAAVAPRFDLLLDASPWATVVDVRDAAGKSISLPSDQDVTPLRLAALAAGTYTVQLRGADNRQKTIQCAVSEARQPCTTDMGLLDIQQLLKGE
ncbi:serine/threonine-protein kinase [Granulicella aggregans]|uniref:non-specific serine/threonine protein kinase n=1 Tax=Granulicella aggregans TaxID=474949 RepID=A0A7W8E7K6_9BACT|nr:serine/threonine-protein kinase [Granulicella aggregans]MBB5060365.1 serine/threonine-protein kinase [Granulicella aggregans]